MPEPGTIGPVPLFFPPFPNEEKMRRGRLNVERPLGGLGESHSIRGEWVLLWECLRSSRFHVPARVPIYSMYTPLFRALPIKLELTHAYSARAITSACPST